MSAAPLTNVLDAWGNVEHIIAELSGTHVTLHPHTEGQKAGPCPFCQGFPDGAKHDGFIVFLEGNWYCRKCAAAGRNTAKGWWLPESMFGQREAIGQEIKQRKRNKWKDAIAELRSAPSMKTIMSYTTDDRRMDVWLEWGFTEEEINRFQLGYCESSPTAHNEPSATVPVLWLNKLIDVRHRILAPEDPGSKYRSHLPGLRPWFYNGDVARAGQTIHMAEGEKKAIILQRAVGPATIAYPGLQTLGNVRLLLDKVRNQTGNLPFREMFVYPDPGTLNTIWPHLVELAKINIEVITFDLSFKIDDFIIDHGSNRFLQEIKYNRIRV